MGVEMAPIDIFMRKILSAFFLLGFALPTSAAVVEYQLSFPTLTLSETGSAARTVSAQVTAFAETQEVTRSWTDPRFAGWTTGWQEAPTQATLLEVEGLDPIWILEAGAVLAWTDLADLISTFNLTPNGTSGVSASISGMPRLDAESGAFPIFDWSVDLAFSTPAGAATLTSSTFSTFALGPVPTLTTRLGTAESLPAPIPLPASGMLLLSVLAGLAMRAGPRAG